MDFWGYLAAGLAAAMLAMQVVPLLRARLARGQAVPELNAMLAPGQRSEPQIRALLA